MTTHVQHVKAWQHSPTGQTVRTVDTASTDQVDATAHTQDVATHVVWYAAEALLVLLAFRFMLALLGANPANAFAHFIYTVSYPFVAPFFGLFGYNPNYSVSHLELYTLVAMAVYGVVAYGIVGLINLTRDDMPY